MNNLNHKSVSEFHSDLASLHQHPKAIRYDLLAAIARQTITLKRPDLFGITILHGLKPLEYSDIWYSAIENPDSTFVRKLVDIGRQRPGTVNGRYGGTLISCCISYNNFDAVKYLFGSCDASFHDTGDADSHDFDLWKAVEGNPGASKELRDYLLGKAKDPSYDLNKVCALHDAAVRGKIDLMSKLMRNGADVNFACQHHLPNAMHGCPPLHYAVEARRLDAMQWLLGHGADPRAGCTVEGGLRAHAKLKHYPWTDWDEARKELEARGLQDIWEK